MLKLGCDMFEGHQPGECLIDDFLPRLPVGSGSASFQQMSPKKEIHPLRVFLYPAAAANRKSSSGVMQEKLISFIQSIDCGLYDCVMIQLRTPKRSSSNRVAVLTVSEQPLAIGELCKGLCRYRYTCIPQNVEIRVIRRYRFKKDFAKSCGLGEDWNYQAVPIFKRGNTEKRQYVGVLEILSYCPQYSKFLYFAATFKICDNLLKSTLVEDVLEKPKVEKVFAVPDILETYGFVIVLKEMRRSHKQSLSFLAIFYSSPGIQRKYSHLLECYKVKPTVETPLTSTTICSLCTSTIRLCAERTPCTVCHVLTSLNKDMLEFVRSEHGLPLIHIWAPCFCDTTSSYTSLFCKRVSIDRNMEEAATYDNVIVNQGPHCVQSEKGLVGRAYWQMKCCFSGDTRQISTCDYPLVAMTNIYNLTACFAIPFQAIHPYFEPIVLETFLPPSYDHINLQALLKSLLSSVAQMLSQLYVGFRLTEDEEFHVEKQAQQDEEKFVFYDVTRRTSATFGNIEDELDLIDIRNDFVADALAIYDPLEANHHSQIIPSDGVEYQEVAEENLDEEQQFPESDQPGSTSEQVAVTSEVVKSKEFNCAISIPTSAAGDDKIEQCFSMTVKATYIGKTEMFPWDMASSGIEELRRELGKRFKLEVGRFDIQYKHEDGDWITLSYDGDLGLYVDTLKASNQSTLKLEINTKEVQITLEKINRYLGCTTQKEAAKCLGVSLSTCKRRCRELGLKRWPYSKRKASLPSSARPKKTKSVEIGQCSNAGAIENEAAVANSTPTGTSSNVLATGNDEIGLCVTNNARNNVAAAANSVPMGDIGEAVRRGNDIIIVRATYKDDTIEFPLRCSSGIQELHEELDAFEIKDERYKIKFEHEDGRWITLLRDTHLSFRIETLKASGRSTMELSVITDSL